MLGPRDSQTPQPAYRVSARHLETNMVRPARIHTQINNRRPPASGTSATSGPRPAAPMFSDGGTLLASDSRPIKHHLIVCWRSSRNASAGHAHSLASLCPSKRSAALVCYLG